MIYKEVLAEVAKATAKFPTWPTDPLHAVAVLGEEFGELTKAVLQLTYEPHKTSASEVRTEAIQTAAMALRFIASLDVYEYRRGEQHAQGGVMNAGLAAMRPHCIDRAEWERRFGDEIKRLLDGDDNDIAEAELESYPETDDDWRWVMPEDAAKESLSYWTDDGDS